VISFSSALYFFFLLFAYQQVLRPPLVKLHEVGAEPTVPQEAFQPAAAYGTVLQGLQRGSCVEGTGRIATPPCLWEVKHGRTPLVQISPFCNMHRDASKGPSISVQVIPTVRQCLLLLFMSEVFPKGDISFKDTNIFYSFAFASVMLTHCILYRGGFGKCWFLCAAGRRSGTRRTRILLTLPW